MYSHWLITDDERTSWCRCRTSWFVANSNGFCNLMEFDRTKWNMWYLINIYCMHNMSKFHRSKTCGSNCKLQINNVHLRTWIGICYGQRWKSSHTDVIWMVRGLFVCSLRKSSGVAGAICNFVRSDYIRSQRKYNIERSVKCSPWIDKWYL